MSPLTPERLNHLLAGSEVQSLSPEARQRLEWIAAYITQGLSISDICVRHGIARSTMHRWIKRFNPDDLSTLEEQTHMPHTLRTSTVDQSIIDRIRGYREKSPLMGKEKIRALLMQEHGIDMSSSTIGRVIEREGLYFAATPLHWKKRVSYKSQMPVTTAPQTTPVAAEVVLKAEPSECTCAWCMFRKTHGRSMRRTFALASLAVNIIIFTVYLATAFWEHSNSERIRADLTQQQTHTLPTVSSLDGR
jgi:putative transposase